MFQNSVLDNMIKEDAVLVRKNGEMVLRHSKMDVLDKDNRKIMKCMEILTKDHDGKPTWEQLFDMTEGLKIRRSDVDNVITSLLREGWIYEPILGTFHLIMEVDQ